MAAGCIRGCHTKSGSGCPDPALAIERREAVSGCSRRVETRRPGAADLEWFSCVVALWYVQISSSMTCIFCNVCFRLRFLLLNFSAICGEVF